MRLRMSKRYHIAVVGATGAVGVEMFRVLERRGFPVASIRAFSSKRSAGKSALFHDEKIPVAELAPDSFRGIDLALFSAGTAVAREFAPIARDAGAIVIDNSSTFRMEPEVPLVIPEINGDDAKLHRGIIANPNCTTAVALMAIYPLHRVFHVQRVFAASYQAVSGSGARYCRVEGPSPRCFRKSSGARGSLSASYRLQCPPAGRCISRKWLHQRRNENAERRPPHHASPRILRLRYLRARSRLPRAFSGGQRGIFRADFGGTGAGDFGESTRFGTG